MAWRVKLADGSLSEPFATYDEASAHVHTIEAADTRSPEEIWHATVTPVVPLAIFLRRKQMGWQTHRALHTHIDGRYLGIIRTRHTGPLHEGSDDLHGGPGMLHEVLGRKRTIAQWSLTSGVSESRLRKGIAKHGTLQAYLLNLGWYPSKPAHPEPDICE